MTDPNPFKYDLDALLEAALRQAPEKRMPFLRNQLGKDTPELTEAIAMLTAVEKTGQFLEKPLISYMAEASQTATINLENDLADLHGYQLGACLGEGGMGKVYRARQTYPIQRLVALKVMKIHPLDSWRAAHFEREYAALAQMEHPNVARLYQAGTTASGFPFFTMELVDGVSLLEYIKQAKPSLSQRLKLFLEICAGVQHAHQKGIIHRDIKPSNILVTNDRSKPRAKLIDFGVARALKLESGEVGSSDSSEKTVLGTVAYMSPEQIRGEADDVRVDVYGLGAIFYEMITGAPAFTVNTSGTQSKSSLMAQVLTDPPLPPSQRLRSKLGNPQQSVGPLARKFTTDLDAIILKAMAKDREARYASVVHLAEDVGRFVEKRPLAAHPHTPAYVMSRWIARNRLPAILLGSIVFAIGLGLGLALWGIFQAQWARQVAEMEKREVERTKRDLDKTLGFLEDVLSATQPVNNPVNTPVSVVLDVAAQEAERALPPSGDIRGRLYFFLAEAFMAIGQFDKAEREYERAYFQRAAIDGPFGEKTLIARIGWAWSQTKLDRLSAAKAGFEEVFEASCPSFLYYRALMGLADIDRLYGRHREALVKYKKVLEGYLNSPEANPEDQIVALKVLAMAYGDLGQGEKAGNLFEVVWFEQAQRLGLAHFETLTAYSELATRGEPKLRNTQRMLIPTYDWMCDHLGPNHEKTLDVLHNLMRCTRRLGEFALAERLCKKLIEGRKETLGDDHQETLSAEMYLGLIFCNLGRFDLGISQLHNVYRAQIEHLGQSHRDTFTTANNLADKWTKTKRAIEAEALLKKSIPNQTSLMSKDHPETLMSNCTLGESLLAQDKLEEALVLFREIDGLGASLPSADSNRHIYTHFHGWSLARLHRFEEAEPLLIASFPALKKKPWVVDNMISFYQAWGKPEMANRYRQSR